MGLSGLWETSTARSIGSGGGLSTTRGIVDYGGSIDDSRYGGFDFSLDPHDIRLLVPAPVLPSISILLSLPQPSTHSTDFSPVQSLASFTRFTLLNHASLPHHITTITIFIMRSAVAFVALAAAVQAVALPEEVSVSNPATKFLTQTDPNGVVTGMPTAETNQPPVVTSQPDVATVPAGLSISNGQTVTVSPTVPAVLTNTPSGSGSASQSTGSASTGTGSTGSATESGSATASDGSATATPIIAPTGPYGGNGTSTSDGPAGTGTSGPSPTKRPGGKNNDNDSAAVAFGPSVFAAVAGVAALAWML